VSTGSTSSASGLHRPGFALPALPLSAATRDGQVVDPAAPRWPLRRRADGGDPCVVAWDNMPGLSPRMLHLARLILAGRIATQAPLTTRNDGETLRRLGAWYLRSRRDDEPALLDWSEITAGRGHAFLQHGLDTTANAGNDFARLRAMYRYGVRALAAAHPELDDEFRESTLVHLEGMKAPGNAKGHNVRAGDETKGELLAPEIEVIVEKLGRHHDRPELRASVWLTMELGRNSLQYVLIRNRDLHCVSVIENGRTRRVYQVAVRRIKKRKLVDEIALWPISMPLGDLLSSLRKGGPDDMLLHWLNPNAPQGGLDAALKAWVRHVGAISPRTGEPLHLNARRFRVTLLTNAADEGASLEKLASLADHSDFQNLLVYVERSPGFLDRIARKVDALYAPTVKRFKGQWTSSDATTGPDGTPAQRILGKAPHLPMLDVGGIGLCGSKALCRLAPPLTCYSCNEFVAFRDGPHEQVVAALERTIDHLADERVAIQIAPSLGAAREVVAALRRERGEAPLDSSGREVA
jgi:hypothetical protein